MSGVDLEAAGAGVVAFDLEFEAVEAMVAQNFAGSLVPVESDGLMVGGFEGGRLSFVYRKFASDSYAWLRVGCHGGEG